MRNIKRWIEMAWYGILEQKPAAMLAVWLLMMALLVGAVCLKEAMGW